MKVNNHHPYYINDLFKLQRCRVVVAVVVNDDEED